MSELDNDALTALVRRHRALESEIAGLKEEQAAIKETVEAAVPTGWKLDVDGVTASRRPGNREFSVITAVTKLDAEAKARCVKTGYDEKLIKAEAKAAGIYEACMEDVPDKADVIKLT